MKFAVAECTCYEVTIQTTRFVVFPLITVSDENSNINSEGNTDSDGNENNDRNIGNYGNSSNNGMDDDDNKYISNDDKQSHKH